MWLDFVGACAALAMAAAAAAACHCTALCLGRFCAMPMGPALFPWMKQLQRGRRRRMRGVGLPPLRSLGGAPRSLAWRTPCPWLKRPCFWLSPLLRALLLLLLLSMEAKAVLLAPLLPLPLRQ